MKKIYSIACSLLAVLCFAQQGISFEGNEGFMTGNIHGQGSWISTPTGGNPENVTHQIISTDKATDGSSSLKIVRESIYGVQPEPVIGGFYNLATPLNKTNFSVSFDINMSLLNESIFGFQGVDNIGEQTVVRVDFDKTGIVKVLSNASGVQNMVTTSGIWSPNVWHTCKVVGTAMEVRYYLNDTLLYTEPTSNSLPMDQLRFVHNNGIATAYFDNIKINNELVLGVRETKANAKTLTIYPNPVTNTININTPDPIEYVEVYDLTGKRMNITWDGKKVDVKDLSSGIYLLNVNTRVGKITEKFIKK